MVPLMDLLAELTLVLKPDEQEGEAYGVNLGSWRAMLADPVQFLGERMQIILQDATALSSFYNNLATVLGFEGFNPPASLAGLPSLLAALGLTEQQPGGFGLVLTAWMDLVQNPVGFVSQQGKLLLSPTDPTLRQALVSALSQLPPPSAAVVRRAADDHRKHADHASHSTRQADPGRRVSDNRCVDHSEPAGFDHYHGGCAVIATGSGAVAVPEHSELGSNQVGEGGGSGRPAGVGVEPVRGRDRWRFPRHSNRLFSTRCLTARRSRTTCDNWECRSPVLLASSLGSTLVNDFVIGEGDTPLYPLVYRIMKDLGLTVASANSELERVQSLAGIFLHPVDWLLSEQSLGNAAGRFDLDKVGTLLNDLPGPDGVEGPGDIRLDPSRRREGHEAQRPAVWQFDELFVRLDGGHRHWDAVGLCV